MSIHRIMQQAAAGNTGELDGVASFQLTTDVVERGFEVAQNGSVFYVPDYVSSGYFHVYEMSTPFDVTTAVRNTGLEFRYASNDEPIDLAVTHDGYQAVSHQFSSSPFKKWTTDVPYDFTTVATTSTTGGSSSLSNGITTDATATHFYTTRGSVVRRYNWSNLGSNSSVSGTYTHYHSTWADNGYLYIAAPYPSANTIHYFQPGSAYAGLSLAGSYTSVELLPDTSLDFRALSYAEGGEMLFVLDSSTSPATVYTFTRAYLESKGVPFTRSLPTDPHWSMLNHDYSDLNSVTVNGTAYTGTNVRRDKVVSVFESSSFQNTTSTNYTLRLGGTSGESLSIKYNAPNATTVTIQAQRLSGTDVNFTLSGDVSGSGTATSVSGTTTVNCPTSGVITITTNNTSNGFILQGVSFNNYTAGDFDYD